LKVETKREVLKYFERLRADTGNGTHDDVVRVIRQIVRPSKEETISPVQRVFAKILLTLSGHLLPGADNPEKFEEYLSWIDTSEKMEALLTSLDEPRPSQRRRIIWLLKFFVPALRTFMLKAGKSLRPPRGGQSVSFSEDEKRAIREEIRRRRGPEKTLKELYDSIAERKGVSWKTVQRACLEEDEDNGTGLDDANDSSAGPGP
jgi:hypothetical protein